MQSAGYREWPDSHNPTGDDRPVTNFGKVVHWILSLFAKPRKGAGMRTPIHDRTIDPVRMDQINKAVSQSEDSIAAGQMVRKASDRVTVKLADTIRQANGMIGTDLLADRLGRYGENKESST